MFQKLKALFNPSVEEKIVKETKEVSVVESEELKASDFPKDKYSAYWEVVIQETIEHWTATVRFYKRGVPGVAEEFKINEASESALKKRLNKLIAKSMEKFKV